MRLGIWYSQIDIHKLTHETDICEKNASSYLTIDIDIRKLTIEIDIHYGIRLRIS